MADEISLYFKTKQSDGLLFYSGDLSDSLIIALREGSIWVLLMLAGETSEMIVDANSANTGVNYGQNSLRPSNSGPMPTRFDDDQWYWLRVKRQVKEVFFF